jgi:hypothetical protein
MYILWKYRTIGIIAPSTPRLVRSFESLKYKELQLKLQTKRNACSLLEAALNSPTITRPKFKSKINQVFNCYYVTIRPTM